MKDKFAEIRSYLFGGKRGITILYVLSAIFIGLNCYFVYRETTIAQIFETGALRYTHCH